MGVLDEIPNLEAESQTRANAVQGYANFFQNQRKWASEREAGAAAASGDWEGAQKAALASGNMPLYQDMHTLHRQTVLELGQKVLGAAMAAKNSKQWHDIIDTMSSHGIKGLNKYRIPPGGDFETTKAATLSELGVMQDYLKAQNEALEQQKTSYQGIMKLPGVSRETPTQFPTPTPGIAPSAPQGIVPGAAIGVPTPEGEGAIAPAAPEEAPASLADITMKLQEVMKGRGIPAPTTTETGPERKFVLSTTAQGEPVYHELPPGAELEGKGTAAKPDKVQAVYNMIHDQEEAAGRSTDPEHIRRLVKDFIQKPSSRIQEAEYAAAPGGAERLKTAADIRRKPETRTAQERNAQRIIDESQGEVKPTWEEALSLATRATAHEPGAIQKLNMLMGPKHEQVLSAMRAETAAETKTTEGERLREAIKTEEGGTTREAVAKIAEAKAAGRRAPMVLQAKGKDATGKDVDGMVYVDPVSGTERFVPHPEGVSDVHKVGMGATAGKLNAELEETNRIMKDKNVDFFTALKMRTEATTHPSSELQALGLLHSQFKDETPEQLMQHRTELNTKMTAKDRQIAAILEDHKGETREDAERRAAAANQLTILTHHPVTDTWEAEPVSGSMGLRKLEGGRKTDLQALSATYDKDPRFDDKTKAEKMVMAASALKQKGYNVVLDKDGNVHYQVAENSDAEIKQRQQAVRQQMVDLRKQVATDPVLAAQMTWARESAKYNVKTEGREAQTAVVDSHVNGIYDLAGGPDLDKPADYKKRQDMASALGYLHDKGNYMTWSGMFAPDSKAPQAARSLLSFKYALQAEVARLLSMGMTGNIAHEHAQELGKVVSELQQTPTVEALFTQLKTIKQITAAIRTLPQVPMDPISAQKSIAARLEGNVDTGEQRGRSLAEEASKGPAVVIHDGHAYRRSLNDDGSKLIWREINEKE